MHCFGDHEWKVEDVADLVGMSEADARTSAERRGLLMRVYLRDDDDLAIRTDHVSRRVNVAIRNGVVTEVLHFG
jgi:hypothetical protein